MADNIPPWLTKQMIKGVRGFNLDAYLVALEGWRRGLTLKWYYDAADVTDMKIIGFNPLGKTFSLSSEDKTHVFYRTRGDSVKNQAVEITSNKDETKKFLLKSQVPTPQSNGFDETVGDKDIIKYGLDLGFPLVLKPKFGSLGKGVVTNIQNEAELREGLHYVRQELGYSDILVERHVSGTDMRLYIAGNRILGGTERVPANILGDGEHTIRDLIDMKNEMRKENHYLKSKLIEIDEPLLDYLKRQDYAIDSIPKKGEFIYLKGQCNIAAGGDPIDVTDKITPEIKGIAINAVKAIPGLYHAGVDVIVNNDNNIHIIEINATADIGMHLFPLKGISRNIPEGIIDFYFPETKGLRSNQLKIYFNYNNIRNLLDKKYLTELELNNIPKKPLYTKRYVISGKVQGVGYRRWIKKKARKSELHGYTKNLNNGKVVVVVGGEKEKVVNQFKSTCYEGPKASRVEKVEELIWDKQINIGFEIRNGHKRKKDRSNMTLFTKEKTVSITAVGDILLHGRVYGGLKNKLGYNFSKQLESAKGLLGKTDITLANLESIIAGKEIGLSSFPKFNAPVEIGYTLKALGVDMVTIANNHVLDRGEEGLLKSIENLEKIGLEYDGAYKSSEDKERLRIIEKNGLKICFISYTSGTNGIKIPSKKPYLVNSLKTTATVNIYRLLRKIKRENIADVIIVSLHFGREYNLYPSSNQKELAASISDAGADVILGHHPHVLQPPEWIENSKGEKTFVAYSLGNFFSGQDGLYRQIGASLSLDVTKPHSKYKQVIIENPKLTLTYVNKEKRLEYSLYNLRDWVESNEYITTEQGEFPSKKVYNDVIKRLRKNISDLEVE